MATRKKTPPHAHLTVGLAVFEAAARGVKKAAKTTHFAPAPQQRLATVEPTMNGAKPTVEEAEPLKVAFSQSARPCCRHRKTIPVTLRLTEAERAQLEDMAAGRTLSSYIRSRLFKKQEKRRKRRSGSVVADKKAIAEALALLGQLRMANNLNQLAHQANIGALVIEDRERSKIDEAYSYILSLRGLLVAALGQER